MQLGYEDLAIAGGMLASTEFVRVSFDKNVNIEERKKVYEDLEKYCALDTKAMVDILSKLEALV